MLLVTRDRIRGAPSWEIPRTGQHTSPSQRTPSYRTLCVPQGQESVFQFFLPEMTWRRVHPTQGGLEFSSEVRAGSRMRSQSALSVGWREDLSHVMREKTSSMK